MSRGVRIPLFQRLQIESQSNCNRSCWFCPRTYDRSGNYLDLAGNPVLKQMPTDKIIDLLHQACEMGFRGHVGFHHYSEPLLDDRFVMLAREARKRDLLPYLHTNGDVLKHNDELCSEIREVCDYVVVGLYDYTTNEELDEAKRFWQVRLEGLEVKFSSGEFKGPFKFAIIVIPFCVTSAVIER